MQENESEWKNWVLSNIQKPIQNHNVPITTSLLSIMGYWAYPSIQRIAINYGLHQLSQMGLVSIQDFFTTLISMPYRRQSPSKKNIDIDSVIKSHMVNGIATKDVFSQITESKQTMMILLVSILSLYFQYLGMTIMKEENVKYQTLTTNILPDTLRNDDINTKFKTYVFTKYDSSAYYNKDTQRDNSLFNQKSLQIKEYDPIRIIYNTMVGLNHTLFYSMGGRSDDPSHEILHWTKILFYWEIMARLLKKNGLGPMKIASELFLQDLWKKRIR